MKGNMSETCLPLQHGNTYSTPAMHSGQAQGLSKPPLKQQEQALCGVGGVQRHPVILAHRDKLSLCTCSATGELEKLDSTSDWEVCHCMSPGCISRRFPSPLCSKGSSWRLLHWMLFSPRHKCLSSPLTRSNAVTSLYRNDVQDNQSRENYFK